MTFNPIQFSRKITKKGFETVKLTGITKTEKYSLRNHIQTTNARESFTPIRKKVF